MSKPNYNNDPIRLNELLQTMYYLINNLSRSIYDISNEIHLLKYHYFYRTMNTDQLYYMHFNLVNKIDGLVVLIYETINKANWALFNRNIEDDQLDERMNFIGVKLKKQYKSNQKRCDLLFQKMKDIAESRHASAHPYSIIPRIEFFQYQDVVFELLNDYYALLSNAYGEITEFEHRKYRNMILIENYGNDSLSLNLNAKKDDHLVEAVHFVR